MSFASFDIQCYLELTYVIAGFIIILFGVEHQCHTQWLLDTTPVDFTAFDIVILASCVPYTSVETNRSNFCY